MRTFLATSVSAGALLIGAVGAQAADVVRPIAPSFVAPVAPAPAFSWSGCYVGANWGWASGTSRARTTTSSGTWLSSDVDISGPLFGGQIGCDMQVGPGLVLGVRGMFDGADINGSAHEFYSDTSGGDHVKIDSLATITGRIGWTGIHPASLMYIQGGVAFAHNHLSFAPSYTYQYFGEQSRVGWTAGIGWERALIPLPGVSFFAEANWVDLGTKRITPFDSSYDTDVTQRFGTVQVGLNFRFH